MKNISKKIRNGTNVITRDEYFEDNNGYVKETHLSPFDLYRETIVVDSNRNNELAVIKLQSGGKFIVKNNKKQIEKYGPYIKIKDNNGNPIILNDKFVRGPIKYDVSTQDANKMKQNALSNKYNRKKNRKLLQELKRR